MYQGGRQALCSIHNHSGARGRGAEQQVGGKLGDDIDTHRQQHGRPSRFARRGRSGLGLGLILRRGLDGLLGIEQSERTRQEGAYWVH